MHIVFGFVRYIVVDYHGDIVDVDTAGENIGGNQYLEATGAECKYHFLACFLVEIGVHFGSFPFAATQYLGEFLDFLLRRRKHDYTLVMPLLEEAFEQALLLTLVADKYRLINLLGRL